ncbi:hypothetical protein Tsp_05115 [Trichinella spiralis]|uniref:hypothetical protein n=1 Tax=Trichinella spiralis TaxID=6334 RepID=UPI0001EFEF01|nr:hypothetical protein Tsp_05115 [Trichinella spiralis]
MLVLVRAHFLDRSVTPVAADVDLSSEVHHQSRIAYIGIGFERWKSWNFFHFCHHSCEVVQGDMKVDWKSFFRRCEWQLAVLHITICVKIKKSMSTTSVTNIIHSHIHFHVHKYFLYKLPFPFVCVESTFFIQQSALECMQIFNALRIA